MNVLLLIFLFLVTACRQEIHADGSVPIVTSVLRASSTPESTPRPTPVPATPTFDYSSPRALPSGPINIITIGDDLTRGDGDEIGRGYPGRLLEWVSQIRPGSTVINFGQSGWTSDDLIRGDEDFSGQLERAVSEVVSASSQGRPSVVLVWIGGNDLWELYAGGALVTSENETADLERFSRNIARILSDLRKAGAEVIVAKLDDQSKRPAQTRSEFYPSITSEELEQMSLQVDRYNREISTMSGRYGVLIVDFYGSEIFTSDETLSPDGFHPDGSGYEAIALLWYKALIPIVP